jgi:hypothetical protein
VKFSSRWSKKHCFYDQEGKEKHVWEIGRGKKYRAHRVMRESGSGLRLSGDLWWTGRRHPNSGGHRYLVKARSKGKPWYLIPHERVSPQEAAWESFFASRRRWQMDPSWRYGTCELAMASPRVWAFDTRLKRLGMVLLVSAFWLFWLEAMHQARIKTLLRLTCHRTGKRCREALVALSRLRWALSRLWDDARPLLGWVLPPALETLRA